MKTDRCSLFHLHTPESTDFYSLIVCITRLTIYCYHFENLSLWCGSATMTAVGLGFKLIHIGMRDVGLDIV